jgi:hypothetical protein
VSTARFFGQSSRPPVAIHKSLVSGHLEHCGKPHKLVSVKRFTPLVVVALAAAAALAMLRGSEHAEPDEDWKPVRPT